MKLLLLLITTKFQRRSSEILSEINEVSSRHPRLDAKALVAAEKRIAHNKIMIIDGDVVLTGSFNFTKAAEEKNAAVTQA